MSEEIKQDGVATPNPEPETITEDVQTNPQEIDQTEKTANPMEENAHSSVDYKEKFTESFKETMRHRKLVEEQAAEIERLKKLAEEGSNNSDALYPGFDMLSDDERKNLLAYTDSIKKQTLNEVYKDPALAFAKQSYNENKWERAFEQVASELPEIRESKDEFKSKFYKKDVSVPDNIKDILTDLSKAHLFDKARDLGMKDALAQTKRIDIERQSGGEKTPKATRTLEDWYKMAQNNPGEFAKQSKQFNEDMASGKLK